MAKMNWSLNNKNSWIIFCMIIGIYLTLQYTVYVHTFWVSDNSNYFYVSKLVSEGKSPYTDFFFAHPPLQPYVYGLLYKLIGYNEIIFRSVPIAMVLLISTLMFLMVKNHWGDIPALLSVFIFLTSKTILWSSSYEYGHYLMLVFLFTAMYFMFERKFLIAGIFVGFGMITRLNILPALIVLAIYVGLHWNGKTLALRSKDLLKFLLGLFVIVVPIFGALILFSKNFVGNVFLFQMTRISHTFSEKLDMVIQLVQSDGLIFVLFLICSFYAFKSKTKLFFVIIIAQICFIFSLPIFFREYFTPILPFMAMICGIGLWIFVSHNVYLLKKKNYIVFSAIILIFGAMAFSTYEYYHLVFIQGQPELPYLKGISSYIASNSNSDDLIFGGGAGFTTEIALRSDRRIALDIPIFDSNVYRSKNEGIVPLVKDLEELVKEKRLKYVIWVNNDQLKTIEEWKEYRILLIAIVQLFLQLH